MDNAIYFSKIEFQESLIYHAFPKSIIHLNVTEGELSYQAYKWSRNMPAMEGTVSYEISGKQRSYDYGKPGKIMRNTHTGFESQFLFDEENRCEIVFEYSYKLNRQEKLDLLRYCNALEFEPYRDREMSMDDEGYCGYRDEIMIKFVGITDSYIPKMEWDMQYYYDEEHKWPSERLYGYLLNKYLVNKKTRGWISGYGAGSLFF